MCKWVGILALTMLKVKCTSVGIIDSMSKKHSKLPSYIFVAVQLVLFGLLIFLPTNPSFDLPYTNVVANIMLFSGVLICLVAIWQLRKYSLTALPAPVSNAKLLTSGLYKYVRHPIYTGVILAFAGVALSSESILKLGLWCILVIFIFAKSNYEESLLTTQFKDYKKYRNATGRFIPKLN